MKHRLDVQRAEDELDETLRPEEVSLHDPAQPPALLGHRAWRQVDVRELEQRDVVVPHVEVVLRRAEQPDREGRAQHALLRRERLGKLERTRVGVVGLQRVRVRLVHAGADEHVRDEPAKALLVGKPAEHRLTCRKRRRHVLEPEPRDLLDDVDVAAHVARAPGRDPNRPVAGDLEPEPLEAVALLGLGDLEPDRATSVRGHVRDRRRRLRLDADFRLARPPRTRELGEELRRVPRGQGGSLRVDALLPPRLRLGCACGGARPT